MRQINQGRANPNRRPPKLTLPVRRKDPPDIVDYAEAKLIVPGSARRGRLKLYEYQKPILRAMVNPKYHTVVNMSSSQSSKTFLTFVLVCYIIDITPHECMFVFVSDGHRKKLLREKLSPMLLANPDIKAKVHLNRAGDLGYQGFSFDDGYMTLATSGGKSAGHGTTAKTVIWDETDDCLRPAKLRADLIQRGAIFEDSKLIMTSTPTIEGESIIEEVFHEGTAERYYVKCPDCGWEQEMDDEYITKDFLYPCINCGVLWDDAACLRAEEGGYFVQTAEEGEYDPKIKSYTFNQLASPLATLESVVEAKKKYSAMEYSTQVLGEPYILKTVDPVKYEQVQRTPRADFELSFITVGVDLQKDRLEYVVVVFDEMLVYKVIYHWGVIEREEDNYEHFVKLRDELQVYNPHMTFVDSSYEPDHVKIGLDYAFGDLLYLDKPLVFPIIGSNKPSFDKNLVMSKYHGTLTIATDEAKVQIHKDLAAGRLKILDTCPDKTEDQLLSEKLVLRPIGQEGVMERRWRKIRRRNEVLDCTVYACAASTRILI